MGKYKLTQDAKVIINTEIPGFVPDDPRNRHYQEYLRWLDEGNKPDSADPPPVLKTPPEDPVIAELKARLDEAEAKLAAREAVK